MKQHGTMHADKIKMTYGIDKVFAGKGDDEVFLFNGLDATVSGGDGHDTFEFRVFEDQSYSVTRAGGVTAVIIDGEEFHQEIILKDFETVVVRELDF